MPAKYNSWSLAPFDEEERRQFFKFRQEDVGDMLVYQVWFAICYALLIGSGLLTDQSPGMIIGFVFTCFFALVCIAIWLLRTQFKERLV